MRSTQEEKNTSARITHFHSQPFCFIGEMHKHLQKENKTKQNPNPKNRQWTVFRCYAKMYQKSPVAKLCLH